MAPPTRSKNLSLLELAELVPNKHMRCVRNIEFDHTDIGLLTVHARNHEKVRSTAMNAYGAIVQNSYEKDNDFLIFSSWLGPVVRGEIQNIRAVGTFEEHVLAACGQDMSIIPEKRYWCFPLCGGSPTHWVLGIVESETRVISIFDSLPELDSWQWAKPVLIDIINALRQLLGSDHAIDFEKEGWSMTVYSSPDAQGQSDAWLCGIFVMMAMQAFAKEHFNFENCVDSHIDEMRSEAISQMLQARITRKYRMRVSADASRDEEMDHAAESSTPSHQSKDVANINIGRNDAPELSESTSIGQFEEVQTMAVDVPGNLIEPAITSAVKRKAPPSACSDDGYSTGNENAKATRSKAAQGKRKPKLTSVAARKQELELDEWVKSVKEHEVLCKGCSKWIKTNAKRVFDRGNWYSHKTKCPGITGLSKQRVSVVNHPKLLGAKGDMSIKNFFKPAGSAQPSNSDQEHTPILAKVKEKVKYLTKTIKTPSTLIRHLKPLETITPSSRLSQVAPQLPIYAPKVPCQGLQGSAYDEYILRTQTRSLGGISLKLRARISRQLFPYKDFPPLRSGGTIHAIRPSKNDPKPLIEDSDSDNEDVVSHADSKLSSKSIRMKVPDNGNTRAPQRHWTATEQQRMDERLKAFARWEVIYEERLVRAATCHRLTTNSLQICDACHNVSRDESFKDAVHRKNVESRLPADEQHAILVKRAKYSSSTIRSVEDRKLQVKLKDPLLADLFNRLQRDQNTGCFLQLYKLAIDGKLKNHQTFTDICDVFADRIRRLSSDNPNLKYGQRYPENYLNFMTLLRSHGQNSLRQYNIVTAQIAGPSPRHLQSLVANSSDAMQNPDLIFENIARLKRFIDSITFWGPVAFAGDCTKVRPRLAYSTSFGGHVIGTTFPLEECTVDDADDIDDIVTRAKTEKAVATQVRAILAKVPLPEVPPVPVAMIPTTGKDTAGAIHEQHMQILNMASWLGMKVISFAADGAASELAAQNLMDAEKSEIPHLTYEHATYGISVRAVVFPITGPLVSITDAPHAMKTARNQPQHGTHTGSLGNSCIINQSLVQLYKTGAAGLQLADVQNVDKQDDGAARRVFHHQALLATTYEDPDGVRHIHEHFRGLFVYLFVLGELFDAWLNRRLDIHARILAALRARFFLHIWRSHVVSLSTRYPDLYSTVRSFISPASFNIFNRLCDTLLMLAVIYARRYPNVPFCPWLLGTEFVEHFFGLARSIIPDFTYAQFLAFNKHTMIRQRILLSGQFDEKETRKARTGYSFDFDNSPLTVDELTATCVRLTTGEIDRLVELGYSEAYKLAKDVLEMSAPSLPFRLSPLSGPVSGDIPCIDDSDTDADSDPESAMDWDMPTRDDADASQSSQWDLTEDVASASADAARDSIFMEQDARDMAFVNANVDALALLPSVEMPTFEQLADLAISAAIESKLVIDGKLDLRGVLAARRAHQALTGVKSQRTVMLDPKLTTDLAVLEGEIQTKMTSREASHRLRLAQDTDPDLRKSKTTRELQWQHASRRVVLLLPTDILPNFLEKNVNGINLLKIGSFVAMQNHSRTGGRFYIGEVLDILKQGAGSGRHGSHDAVSSTSGLSYLSLRVYLPLTSHHGVFTNTDMESDDLVDDSVPNFSCLDRRTNLHTHGKAADILYNLGTKIFVDNGQESKRLKTLPASQWQILTQSKFTSALQKAVVSSKENLD